MACVEIAACHYRLKQSPYRATDMPRPMYKENSQEKSSEAILQLCAELYDQDAASLQVKVIKYLQQQTDAESGFLVLVSSDNTQLFCQVVGGHVLEEEIKFPAGIEALFKDPLLGKQPLYLKTSEQADENVFLYTTKTVTHDDLNRDQFDELCRFLHLDIKSLLGVPVISRVTGNVVAIACVVNKIGHDRFSNGDVDAIQHCFKYTATVLTSTVAFQNERKLKNQTEALLQVAKNLFTHLDDLTKLLREIMQEARNLTKAERCSVFLLDRDSNELVAKVFDGNVANPKNPEAQTEIRIPANQGIAGHVATSGEILNIRDAYAHPLFYRGVDESTGFRTRNILCFPIMDEKQTIVGVAQLCNKKDGSCFTSFDEDIARAFSIYCCISIVQLLFSNGDVDAIQHCFKYTATVLTSTVAFQNERKLKNQTEALLQVAKNLFTHLDDLTKLLREIMQEARNLTKAERCSVFLLDRDSNELVAKVFDGNVANPKNPEAQTEIRIPANQGIAGHVATSGEILNIRDAYAHPLFYRGVDESTGFRTRNILCFPIMDEKQTIVGVAQLCNKKDGSCFTSFDEDIARAFSIYCCISIVQSLLYNKAMDAQHRVKLSTELMTYHMQVGAEEAKKLSVCEIPPLYHFSTDMDKFSSVPRNISELDTPLACISMFEEQGFITRWRIKRESLARFVLMVKKGYRDPPYHNWMHAFAVAHFCFILNKNLHLENYLDELEIFALFVSCLCHDIDHRGTNNSFQVASQSVLAALYSSEGSVMERHHIAQTMCVLNTEGCNIFENLSRKEYERVLDSIRDIILATDLAHHLGIIKDLEVMAEVGYNKDNMRHHELLLCLLMTACDLSDQTKYWKNSQKIARLIYKEFFSQGDLERALGREPSPMMDRERACIPELQIGFLDGIALPVYSLLSKLFPLAEEVHQAVLSNKRRWSKVGDKLRRLQDTGDSPIDVFNVDVTLEEEEVENGNQR
ncbi:cGMP-dependent 3',5'-cyclic phosphodiesterase-like [Lingula anatina]|uniref:Phosphodiesterase n=1 Tax=Lingula anatina TaxID=7574 RepID=A0A1S3JM94_LINAN|nr:cGMP-dependent 3',5'-cyclic phosphodiesterase-like [Lingula anatina]|eukprot:XP_013411508.1 cGMP-dependent 3',5'-cyclic phosphodiesterase-like [Lingula anatina]